MTFEPRYVLSQYSCVSSDFPVQPWSFILQIVNHNFFFPSASEVLLTLHQSAYLVHSILSSHPLTFSGLEEGAEINERERQTVTMTSRLLSCLTLNVYLCLKY